MQNLWGPRLTQQVVGQSNVSILPLWHDCKLKLEA